MKILGTLISSAQTERPLHHAVAPGMPLGVGCRLLSLPSSLADQQSLLMAGDHEDSQNEATLGPGGLTLD